MNKRVLAVLATASILVGAVLWSHDDKPAQQPSAPKLPSSPPNFCRYSPGAWRVFDAMRFASLNRVGVSPVTVVVALLIGAELWGLVGAILAIPTAAILSVIVQELASDAG